MILLIIEMDVPITKQKEFLQTLIVILERIKMEHGCISCEFLKDVGFDSRYRVIGKWEKKDDLQNHLSSKDFSVLRGAMSLLQRPPEVNLYVESSKQGIKNLHTISDRQKTNNLNT